MALMKVVAARLRALWGGDTVRNEIEEEYRFHIDLRTQENLERGMSAEEARRDAERRFGHLSSITEAGYDVRGGGWVEALGRDVRYGARVLRRNPGFTAAAVLSIGLGIAANATIFAMVSRFVLRPAPVADSAALMSVYTTQRGDDWRPNLSWPLFTDLRDQAQSFSGVAAYVPHVPASLGGTGEPERVWGQAATANFFDVAQPGMTLGRGFTSDEEHLPVIVLGHRLWQRRFGADQGIAGKAVTLSGRPYTVVGVAPPAFRGLDLVLDAEFWVPLATIGQVLPGVPDISNRDARTTSWVQVAGRLAPGVTRAQAAVELDGLARRLADAYPEADKDRALRLEPAGSLPLPLKAVVAMFLGALTAVVLLVLCIAGANVANLLLAQASGRQREMAVRLALGATRGQLLRQMLTESLLLALGGGLVGVALSVWATGALSAFRLPAPVPIDLGVGVDWKVLLFTFALSVGTGVLVGLVPAWVASRPLLASALKGEDVLARSGRRWSLRNVLVVSQIAMSLILLCATGLFLRSLQRAADIDVGFRSSGILMMSVDPQLHGYTAERTTQFLTEVRERVATLPGVTAAAWTDSAPLSMGGRSDAFHAEGRPTSAGPHLPLELFLVTPGYFETLGIPFLAGRDFAGEGATAPKVAVVNEACAQRLFENENAVGQRVTGGGVTYEIIGVVKTIKSRTLGEDPRPVLYRSLEQDIGRDPSFVGYSLLVRAAGDSAALSSAVRGEIRSLDPTLAIFDAETMEEHLRDARFLPRLAGTLFGIFGVVGLLLAAIGLYGVMSYSVSRRTHEIGIRLALGAQSGGVQRLIIRQGMLLTVIGALLGLAAALPVAKLAAAMLYGVPPHDVMTFTAVPLFLAAVAFVACWIPARRAARVDPLTALRHE